MMKKNISKLNLGAIALTLLISSTLNAQKNYEFGARTGDFRSFELILKKQKSENTFMRYRIGGGQFGTITFLGDLPSESFGALGFSGALGWEKRVPLGKNVTFNHGWEPGISIDSRLFGGIGFFSIDPQISYVLGLQYNPSKQLGISVEALPNVSSNFLFSGSGLVASTFSANFNSRIAAISVVYRFEYLKKENAKKENSKKGKSRE